jgi:hypothetical protein
MPSLPTRATAEGVPINLSRRGFLACTPAAAGALLPVAALAATAPLITPEEELERAAGALMAAMSRAHDRPARLEREGARRLSVVVDDVPADFEFAGAGLYELTDDGARVRRWIERAAEYDQPDGYGRAFWVSPAHCLQNRSLQFDIALTGKAALKI